MGLLIGASCGVIVAVASALGLMRPFDLRLHDWCYRVRGPVTASDRIAIVEIDDQTIRAYGDVWPLPRRNYAVAIDALENAGAQAIAFDLLFSGDNTEDPGADTLLAAVTAEHDNVVQAMAFQRSDASMSGEMALVADSTALIRHPRSSSSSRTSPRTRSTTSLRADRSVAGAAISVVGALVAGRAARPRRRRRTRSCSG